MSDSESDESANVPPREVCEARCQEFATVTGTDSALAMFYLQDREWDLQRAVNAYFEQAFGGSDSQVSVGSTASITSSAATDRSSSLPSIQAEPPAWEDPEPHRIRLMTWNIDGLDDNNLKTRTTAVCDKIKADHTEWNLFYILLSVVYRWPGQKYSETCLERPHVRAVALDRWSLFTEKPDVVFLQEVVPTTLELLELHCPQYQSVTAGSTDYFVAMLLRTQTATCLSHTVVPFYSSLMGRNLLQVEAEVKGVPMSLLTSHLESTKDHGKERKHQLSAAWKAMKEAEPQKTVLFGGDLNLRDKEIEELGGIPESIFDIWEVTGKRPEAKFTWDMTRNDNLEWHLRFKPRCRFDRIFMRHSAPKQALKPVYFELTGIERIKSCRRFPSDHWGLLAHFDKKT